MPVKTTAGHHQETKEADIVIYKDNKPYIVIEAKSPKAGIDDDSVAQLDSYAMWLPAKFDVICDGRVLVLRGYFEGNERVYLINKKISQLTDDLFNSILKNEDVYRASDIPTYIIQDQSDSFSSLLKKIHQDIRDIDKLDPTNAFDEWSKLLFMKINEEKWTKENNGIRRLSYSKLKEAISLQNGKEYIDNLFEKTKAQYPNIFSKNDQITLGLPAIESILRNFDGYFINEIPMDVKGRAYEIFLSSTFRGKGLGQYFTPRQVVEFMIEMVTINHKTKLLDPACGTGGFLINGFKKLKEYINNIPEFQLESWGITKDQLLEEIKKGHIFGVDAEPRATKTAKMNMIMWGDGENVFRGNGLDNIDINNQEYPYKKQEITLILANPPFGNKEKDDKVLDQYDLYKFHNIKKTESLFIEKALRELEPKGELAIVIPMVYWHVKIQVRSENL